MQLTWRHCKTSWHYCFSCLKRFDPKTAKLCSKCNWLVCPICGQCYCYLDEDSKNVVEAFYSAHCVGRNCPYGKGGTVSEGLPLPSPQEIEDELLQKRLQDAEEKLKDTMNKGKDKVKWYLVDHGADHIRRVDQNLESAEKLFEKISIARNNLGRSLTQEEIFKLKVAIAAHDIGRTMDDGKSHAMLSSEYVQEDTSIPLNATERREIAELCLLHSEGATREVYGTGDIAELLKRGILSPEVAYKATLLRISDACDAGKERAEVNTFGQSRSEVLERVNRELPNQAHTITSHWHGHEGFEQPKLKKDDGKLAIEVILNSKALQSHGSDIAFRIKDMLRDFRSTIVHNNYSLELKADNYEALQAWYSAYHLVLEEEIEGAQVKV